MRQSGHFLLGRRSLLGGLAGAMALATLPGKARAQQAPVIIGRNGWLYPAWFHFEKVDYAGLSVTADLILQTHEACAAAGIMLLPVLLPMKARIYPENLPADAELGEGFDGKLGLFQRTLAERGTASYDASADVAAVKQQTLAFYKTDVHWTLAAAEAVGQALATSLLKADLLKPGKGPGFEMRGIVYQEQRGDLAQLLPAAAQSRFPLERFAFRNLSISGKALERMEADIAVVGNSMTNPAVGFVPRMAATLQQPVQLFWNYGNLGPWKILLDYIEGDGFRRHPPKILVWVFTEGVLSSDPAAAEMFDAESLMPRATWLIRMKSALDGVRR